MSFSSRFCTQLCQTRTPGCHWPPVEEHCSTLRFWNFLHTSWLDTHYIEVTEHFALALSIFSNKHVTVQTKDSARLTASLLMVVEAILFKGMMVTRLLRSPFSSSFLPTCSVSTTTLYSCNHANARVTLNNTSDYGTNRLYRTLNSSSFVH